MGAYFAAGMLEFAGDGAILRLLAPDARIFNVLSMIVGLTTMVLSGCFAARIRHGAATTMAWIVMISVVVLMVTRRDSVPLWYQIAFLIIGPVATWAGGTLFLKRQK